MQQPKADFSQIFDGEELSAVQETNSAGGVGTSIVIPENLMHKMAIEGFIVHKRNRQSKKDAADDNE